VAAHQTGDEAAGVAAPISPVARCARISQYAEPADRFRARGPTRGELRGRPPGRRMLVAGAAEPDSRPEAMGFEASLLGLTWRANGCLRSTFARLHSFDAGIEGTHEVYQRHTERFAYVPQFQQIQPPGAQFVLRESCLRAIEQSCNIRLSQGLFLSGLAQQGQQDFLLTSVGAIRREKLRPALSLAASSRCGKLRPEPAVMRVQRVSAR
jgi:hypothetical protein